MKNNDPLFWPGGELELSLRQQFRQNYNDSINILQTVWTQCDLDQRFVMGDQDIWGLLFPNNTNYRGKIFNFNLINSMIQMIGGYQRRNRKSTICIPIKNSSQKTADQITKCLFHVHNKCGAWQTYSDAFEMGALSQGAGFIAVYPDYSQDPISPDIRLRYVDVKSCLFDPFFRDPLMGDARFFSTRQFFSKQEAALLYPQLKEQIEEMPRGTYRDDKFYYMPEVYQIQFPDLIAMDEYWYQSTRKARYLIDRETEECKEFKGDEEDLRIILMEFKDKIAVVDKSKPTYRRAIFINDHLMVDEKNPYGMDRLPYVPTLAYFTADTPYYNYKFRSVTRDLRDAQYLYARLKVSNLDILESQQQGIKIKKGALVTPDDALNAGHGRVLTIDPKFQMSDVEQMPIIPPSPTMIQMEELLSGVMNRICGVNEAMLGVDINDKAGIISMLRQSAGMTTLTRLFDNMDMCQIMCGQIIVEMIQNMWTYGKVRSVIGEEPTHEFDDKAFLEYGCKVIQGSLTETQQQLGLQQLLYFREVTGIQIPSKTILEASTLQNKDQLIKDVQEEEQRVAQQQQQMAQLQMQQISVDNQTKIAYAKAEMGLAEERKARVVSDIAIAQDKIRKSHQEDTASLLNVVKAIKELQGMNLDQLEKKLQILGNLNEKVNPEETRLEMPLNPADPSPPIDSSFPMQ